MYCQHCGTKLPDGAKFCVECGERTMWNERELDFDESEGTLSITRNSNSWNEEVAVQIWIDGVYEHDIFDGETIEISLPVGEYTVSLRQRGYELLSRLVDIQKGSSESIRFKVTQPTHKAEKNVSSVSASSRSNPPAAGKPRNLGGHTCPKCGGIMTTQIVTESRKTGCGTILLYVLLALTIFGLLIVIPLALRKKTITVTYSVCQSCGFKRVISRG